MLKRLWAKWKSVAGIIGDFQARLILTIFYFVIAAPFALLTRAFSDPLNVKQRSPTTLWSPKPPADSSIEAARSQF